MKKRLSDIRIHNLGGYLVNKTIKVDDKNIELFIYIAFCVGYLLQTSYLPSQFRSMRSIMILCYCVGYIFCVFKLLRSKYTVSSLILTLIFVFTGIATLVANKSVDFIISSAMLNFFLVIICVRNVSFEEIIRIDLIIKISFTLILVLLCCYNIVDNVTTIRTSGVVRYSMGFAHPNRLGSILFLMVLYYTYIRRDNLSLKDLIFQIIMIAITYKLTDSRSSEFGIMIVIILTTLDLLKRHRENKAFSKLQRGMIVVTVLAMIVAMFYLTGNYNSDNSQMIMLNKLFSSRLELGELTLKYYKSSLFGAGIQTYAWDYVLSQGVSHALVGSDIMYLYIYLNYGIVSFLIYLYVIVMAVVNSAKTDKWGCLCLIIILIVSCMENQYLPVTSNVFVLYFGLYLKNSKTKRILTGVNND